MQDTREAAITRVSYSATFTSQEPLVTSCVAATNPRCDEMMQERQPRPVVAAEKIKKSEYCRPSTANHTATSTATPVSPKCARCKNHGVLCALKGHKGLCKWKNCTCANCSLIVERQKIMAAEQSVLKEMAEQRKYRNDKNIYEMQFAGNLVPSTKYDEVRQHKQEMTGVHEYICLHFGSEEARLTMTELEEWGRDKARAGDPQACYLNILRRLFPDIKPKVLQLLFAACDADFIKTIETILPCCKKLKSNGHVTYIKASMPPHQRMMTLLSRNNKLYPGGKIYHDKHTAAVRRFAPYTSTILDRLHHTRGYPPLPAGMFLPPYAPISATTSGENCGLCVPGFLPRPYYYTRPRISPQGKPDYSISTTPKFSIAEHKPCHTIPRDTISRDTISRNHSASFELKDDVNRTSAAATLISLSNQS